MRKSMVLLGILVAMGGCTAKHELATCKGGLVALNQSHWQPGPSEIAEFDKVSVLDGKETIPEVSTVPDATGTTLRIAHSDTQWILRNGDDAGCLFNLGPDPEGRSVAPVANSAR